MAELLVALIAAALAGAAAFTVAQRKARQPGAAGGSGSAEADRILAAGKAEAAAVAAGSKARAAEAKARALSLIEEDLKDRRAEIARLEDRVTTREASLLERSTALDIRAREIADARVIVDHAFKLYDDKVAALEARDAGFLDRLAELAGMTVAEARDSLVAELTETARHDAGRYARTADDNLSEDSDRRTKKMLATAIQRYSGRYPSDRPGTNVTLTSDEVQSRLVDAENLNLTTLEKLGGVDTKHDPTSRVIGIASQDSVRREIARITLERLASQQVINPDAVKAMLERVQGEMDNINREAGKKAANILSLAGLDPAIVKMMGRLKYRTSYAQNIWSHSIEVGWLCGLMAEELKLNVKLARRCGFLHDIGKAMDHDVSLAEAAGGGHAMIGAVFLKEHGEDEIVVNAVAAHHDEVKQNSVYAHLVIAGDAISGARPGARREMAENYQQRLRDIERISGSFKGVAEAYAVQAGREVRVMVERRVSDAQAFQLSKEIALKIEAEMTYPGQIKVTVIRETRAEAIAR